MRALHRKLLRDLWRMRGQVLAIMLVIGSGVATLVMSVSCLRSLLRTRDAFYAELRFADVFASLERAPEALATRLAEIPGVRQVETRVLAPATLELEGYHEPIVANLLSIPDLGQPELNRLHLVAGRTVAPGRADEAVLSDAFAELHGIAPGDLLEATVNGRRKRLEVVGIALGADTLLQAAPDSVFPDFERFALLWLPRTALEAAYDMEGAFNDVSLALAPGASRPEVIARIDELLEPYGGLGAYGREDQRSHRYLSEEFKQLAQMARIFPTIFLGVAAFLLNVVTTRLIRTQREQIAALKAFGYRDLEVGLHYLQMVLAIALVGAVLGIGLGGWLGRGLSDMYMDYYRFPELAYRVSAVEVLIALGVSLAAAATGALFAVRGAVRLPPAEAMRPEAPARYRVSLVERLGLGRLLAQPARMVVRNLERTPLKTALTVVGIAFACAVLIVGAFFSDTVDYVIDVQYGVAQREDLAVTFVQPTSRRALFELASLPGVDHVEGFRAVPVRLRNGSRSYRTTLQGLEQTATLHRLLDRRERPLAIPDDGVLLTDYLAARLGLEVGDRVTVEVLEGKRQVVEVQVVRTPPEFFGLNGTMALPALNRLLGEGNAVSGAYVAAQDGAQGELVARLDERPRVAGVVSSRAIVRSFRDTMAQQMLTFAFFNTLLASTIAVGVVYNSARIALAERSRELGSLRVLGLTRGEVAAILLGEQAALTLLALPVGWGLGYLMCAGMVGAWQNDLFRIPLVIDTSTYAFASAVVLVASAASALVVRRQLDRLDLIEVLKTRE